MIGPGISGMPDLVGHWQVPGKLKYSLGRLDIPGT